MLAASEYSSVVWLILVVIALVSAIMIATHAIGPYRHGKVKDSTYESGVEPIGDARRRFNVRFYLVAVLFVVFDVEIIFLYPWATLYPRLSDPKYAEWSGALAQAGYSPMFWAASVGLFFALLTIGFLYEWRKGVFKWD